MEFSISDEKDIFVMKLMNYFITKKNYSPIIIHGINNEIWLENPKEEYRIIRIVTKNIYNDEQYKYDVLKTKHILTQVKKRMLLFNVNTLSILVDVGENFNSEINNEKYYATLVVKDEKDVMNNELLNKYYNDINDSMNYKEDGIELISKITNSISEKNIEESEKRSKMFKKDIPYITYILILINIIIYIITVVFSGNFYQIDSNTLYKFGGLVTNNSEYIRMLTCAFLHAGLIHLISNMYALYIVGTEVEQFFGKVKFIFIYIISAIMGSLFSVVFSSPNSISVGASGAIFGLFGAILYFGYNYRGYIGNAILNQMLPVVIVNLFIGTITPNISTPAHVGGLIGGFAVSQALGANLDEEKSQKINGMIILILLTLFMIYMGFFR